MFKRFWGILSSGHDGFFAQFMGLWTSTCQHRLGQHLSSFSYPTSSSECSCRVMGMLSHFTFLAIKSYLIYAAHGFTMQLSGSIDLVLVLERWYWFGTGRLCWRFRLFDRWAWSLCRGMEICTSFCHTRNAIHTYRVSSIAGCSLEFWGGDVNFNECCLMGVI